MNAFTRLNIPVVIGKTVEDVNESTKIVLPGVGAFDYVMNSFNESGLREIVEYKVISKETPVLGICSGMQIMACESEEGKEKGLSWVPGTIKHFDISKILHKTKVPHMGWNEVNPSDSKLFSDIITRARFYFVHSYIFDTETASDVIGTTEYGSVFASAVARKNIFGVQYHPEKSHANGMLLLKNFAELA